MKIYRRMRISLSELDRLRDELDDYAWIALDLKRSALCAGDEYLSVVAQGVCDDGSAVDIEFTRCKPSVDDDIEIGGSDATEVTLALNPIIYNSTNHSSDGYPQHSYRMGDYSTTEKMRLNASTGAYAAVQEQLE